MPIVKGSIKSCKTLYTLTFGSRVKICFLERGGGRCFARFRCIQVGIYAMLYIKFEFNCIFLVLKVLRPPPVPIGVERPLFFILSFYLWGECSAVYCSLYWVQSRYKPGDTYLTQYTWTHIFQYSVIFYPSSYTHSIIKWIELDLLYLGDLIVIMYKINHAIIIFYVESKNGV